MYQKKSQNVGVIGIGSYTPEKILNNADLEKIVETNEEWIIQRTGIKERRILEKDVPMYVMGLEAAKRAVEDSGINAEEIGLIIFATSTPDYMTPTGSSRVQAAVGAKNAAAFDMIAGCTGFIYGMVTAKQFIENNTYKYVLLVSCEGMSRAVDWTERKTCVLFGDGAGAVLMGPTSEEYGIKTDFIASDGDLGENITIPCYTQNEQDFLVRELYSDKKAIWQHGAEVFKFAVKAMPMAAEKVICDAGMTIDDIKYVVPHQANSRIIESAAKRMNITNEKIYTTIEKYGNISSASIPVALDDAYKNKNIKKGDNLVLVAFGGGLAWGALLLTWGK